MKLSTNQISLTISIVKLTLDQLYERDLILFENKVHERAIAFRFALYFNELIKGTEFEELDLDFEYNKREKDYKRTPSRPNGSYPDFILHKRGVQEHNTLVVEFKCVWSKTLWEDDFNKLIDYTSQSSESRYQYGLGLFIELGHSRDQVRFFIFQEGSYE